MTHLSGLVCCKCKPFGCLQTLDDDFDTDNGFSGNVSFGLAIVMLTLQTNLVLTVLNLTTMLKVLTMILKRLLNSAT